jgi:hypothetical protein
MQLHGKQYVNSIITTNELLSIIWRPLPNQHYWFLYVYNCRGYRLFRQINKVFARIRKVFARIR